MTIKLPRYVTQGNSIVDARAERVMYYITYAGADDYAADCVCADEVAAALNATADAPDLTALREAWEAYNKAERAWNIGACFVSLEDVLDAVRALFPAQGVDA